MEIYSNEITYVDERINTAILDHLPGILGSGDVRLAVQRNVSESVAVEELNSPFDKSEKAVQDAKDGHANHAANSTLLCGFASSDGAKVAEKLDNGDKQTTQADGAKAVGEGALGGTASGILGEVVDAEVPGAKHTRDDGVDCVFEPFGDPVHGKRHKSYQSDDLGLATPTPVSATVWICL